MISVVMGYYNRRQHLINTLHSMNKNLYKNFEVIVVDDASDEEHRIEDLQENFKFLKVIRINKEDKKHINPSIPYNIGFNKCIGDIIIIQNPECFHYDDIFDHAIKNVRNGTYLAYSTLNVDLVGFLQNLNWNNSYNDERVKIFDVIKNIKGNWYCHSKLRPKAYHFCSAITRDDLKDLNGFDERYGSGIDYDDDEFLHRITIKGMNVKIVDNVAVIHQSHAPFSYQNPRTHQLRIDNKHLFDNVTKIENKFRANPNKIILKII